MFLYRLTVQTNGYLVCTLTTYYLPQFDSRHLSKPVSVLTSCRQAVLVHMYLVANAPVMQCRHQLLLKGENLCKYI